MSNTSEVFFCRNFHMSSSFDTLIMFVPWPGPENIEELFHVFFYSFDLNCLFITNCRAKFQITLINVGTVLEL